MSISLRAKITSASALLLIFLVSLYAVFQVRMSTQDLERQTERLRQLRLESAQAQGTQAVLAVSASSHFWIADNDFSALDGQLKPVVEDSIGTALPISEAVITDPSGQVLASAAANTDAKAPSKLPSLASMKELKEPKVVLEGDPPERVQVTAPIRDNTGRLWGFTRFIYELEGLREDLKAIESEAVVRRTSIWQRAGLIGMFVVLLGVVVSVIQALAITRPIMALSRSANRIAEGDLATRVAVSTQDEIGVLAAHFNHMADRIEGLLSDTATKMALEKELEVARIIQETLLPEQGEVLAHGAVTFAGAFRPASTCGGDFWTHAELSGHRLLLAVGDVTGHGVPSAMITAACKSGLDTLMSVTGGKLNVSGLMEELNTTIHAAAQRSFFMTFFAVVIDPQQRVLHFANAGHNFPIVVRRQPDGGWRSRALVARGNRLGDVLGSHYDAQTIQVSAGDLLCLYTDGVTEYRNKEGKEFGERRLRRLLERAAREQMDPKETVHLVMTEVETFGGSEVQEDDITLVIAHFG
ncbi:MAG: SpoIIE family protein phosphatase [Myxococcota bacterium]